MKVKHSPNVDVKRREAHDPLAEQVGRITKSLAYLQSQGVDIGPDGAEQVARVQAVKDKFKKRSPL